MTGQTSESSYARHDMLNRLHSLPETVTELRNEIRQMKAERDREIEQLSSKLDVAHLFLPLTAS